MTYDVVIENLPYVGFLKWNYFPLGLAILYAILIVLLVPLGLIGYWSNRVDKESSVSNLDMYIYVTLAVLLIVSYFVTIPIHEKEYIEKWKEDYLHPYMLTLEPIELSETLSKDYLLDDVGNTYGEIIFFEKGTTQKEQGVVAFNTDIEEPIITKRVLDKDIETNIGESYKANESEIYVIELPISYYEVVQEKTLSFN